jgi:glycosyltransferase involved in cell wall biosynthesis/predicted O-methyltransferase YrrM
MSVRLQDKDYVSPGLRVVVPDASFPRMRPGDRWSHPWKYLRREVPHTWYADERYPLMGFVNRDEAAILHNIALQFAGKPALEIGSWLGWSTCHLALARVRLDVIDPAHADPEVRAIVDGALAHCHVADSVYIAATRSPEGVHALAVLRGQWNLFFIDGDHEGEAPVRDVHACLPYAAEDCAFVFHDLAAPAVAAALRVLQREGFEVMVYQTAQIMGVAWRGSVAPVAHTPDPDVAWQLPHHLVGLPVSGVDFAACSDGRDSLFIDSLDAPQPQSVESAPSVAAGASRAPYRQLRDVVGAGEGARRSVCIVSSEIVGPFKNGGIGTSMTGLAERLADAGHRVTLLYTGGLWQPDVPLGKWKSRYAALGIELVALSIEEMQSLAGPLRAQGFVTPHLVYRYLAARHFDVVHFNDCGGEGSLCIVAKRLGLGMHDTLLLVALHSPSEWVLEQNQSLPTSPLMSAFKFAERLSVKYADALWSPSRYLVDWAVRRGFELPAQTFVQQYCLPSRRLLESGDRGPGSPEPKYGRAAPPKEIVFFGRLEERKGLRLFCNAIQRLSHELTARRVGVTFLGKAETCGGLGSLAYIARRSRAWNFPVRTITDLGQPEALQYLLSGERLAVMPSRVDNSPCTVYEALFWGIPFIAARSGGVPELVHDDDQHRVLVDCTTEAFRASLLAALDSGGWVARASQSQEEARRVWAEFHANAARYLPSRDATDAPSPRVVAIVDARSGSGLEETLTSVREAPAVCRVIVLNRAGVELPPCGQLPVFNLDLLVNDPEDLEHELAAVGDDAVLMLHSGVELRADAFAGMLAALGRVAIDGLAPAAEIVNARGRRILPSLGGAPSFTFFNGATFTGGLLVRGAALARARLGRSLAVDSPFMGLADFCVTRGGEVWPYPVPVFGCPGDAVTNAGFGVPARLQAYDDCSAIDRYYMLATGYGAANAPGTRRFRLRAALALIDFGFAPLVAAVSWTVRRWRRIRSHGLLRRPARDATHV